MVRETDVQLQGELQMEVMRTLWRRDQPSCVEDVRKGLPRRHRGAYTTVQTILNRLTERRLVGRERRGKTIFYEATVSEVDYYSGSVRQALASASDDTRRTAIAQLFGDMDRRERDEIESLAREVASRRGGSKR